jgi:hypothetical protein
MKQRNDETPLWKSATHLGRGGNTSHKTRFVYAGGKAAERMRRNEERIILCAVSSNKRNNLSFFDMHTIITTILRYNSTHILL